MSDKVRVSALSFFIECYTAQETKEFDALQQALVQLRF